MRTEGIDCVAGLGRLTKDERNRRKTEIGAAPQPHVVGDVRRVEHGDAKTGGDR
jgi:ribosomal protein S8E